ncbi:hypothetical protein LZ554_005299 [Drepanopeziza brunnea f. sp. 'monogermtubi']|nr:hypothetical protein LZ554_005299 [Drepanopeziza brunnea f. sp. 'monogermtubi']
MKNDQAITSGASPLGVSKKDGVCRTSSVKSEGELGGSVEDVEKTKRGLKPRHAQMIALGGTIGTGLFVGSGSTLARGGPLFILITYSIVSVMVLFVVTAIVEVSAYLPVSGGTMGYYGHRNVSKSLGFAMGWLYWYSLAVCVPYEITAAGIVTQYWDIDVHIGIWITIFIIVIVGLNTLPVQYYGETEFWFASLKVFMMIALLILSFILFWGGGPNQHGILGFRYWKDPGATRPYLRTGSTGLAISFFKVLVSSAFPFLFGPELLVVTAGEMKSPRRNLPIAARRYLARLIFFYIGSVLAIGIICPSDDPRLTSGGVGAGSSAFVVGIANAGISVFDSMINAIVITSAWSSGNSFLYMSSRSLYSLAVAGSAPKIFARCTKQGVPYMAVGFTALFSGLAYLNVASDSAKVFNWHPEKIPYRAWMQPYGAYAALVFFLFLALINGFDIFWPQLWSIENLFTAYIGIPIFLCIYFGHRIYRKNDSWLIRAEDVDLHTGIDVVLANELPEKNAGTWKKKLQGMFT